MIKNKAELVMDVINRKNTTYLPSQITFANLEKKMECANYIGIKTEDEYDEYLGNHYKFTFQLDDVAGNGSEDKERIQIGLDNGYIFEGETPGHILDRWGLEYDLNAPTYFNYGHPLNGIVDNPEILDTFKAPELKDLDLMFAGPVEDLEKYSDEMLVVLSGYNGIWEKSYELAEIQEFLVLLYQDPDIAGRLMDIVTDYKVEIAKETVKRGFKIGHHGDDLGTQENTMFSEELFTEHILPRLTRLFKVYKDAGIPVQMHTCGYIIPFIPYLIEAGVNILDPIQPTMDIKYLKKEFGKDLIFYGGIDTQELLTFKSPTEVREQTLRTIEILGKDGGYIVAPSQEVMNNVPAENVDALVKTIREVRGEH